MRRVFTTRCAVPLLLLFLPACGAEGFSSRGDSGIGIVPDEGPPATDLPVDNGQDSESKAPLAVGAACAVAADCDSGFCVDGVCCHDACNGPCVSCAKLGNEGTCTPHAMASDPENECDDRGAATCGQDGLCDGAGKCRLYAATTECTTAVCTTTTFMPAGQCDGRGVCQKAAITSCGKYQCQNPSACRATCTTAADCHAPNGCFDGACGGIQGQYYGTVDFGNLVVTRVDPSINFDWASGVPAPGVPMDLFSVRWTGTLTPRFSETYTFYTNADDGTRLWINGQLLIDDWTVHAPRQMQGTIALQAGKPVSLKLEYFEQTMGAVVQLRWSSTSEAKAVIPTSALHP